jgi:outer membrane protein
MDKQNIIMKKMFFAAAIALISLAGCRNNQSAATDATSANEGTAAERAMQAGGMSVAYINIDSLILKYDMAIELRNAFESKYNRAERELQAKAQRLEKDVLDYQDKASKRLMTRQQMAETEERLGKQQQELMTDRETRLGELGEEDQVMNNRVFFAVSDYLKEYNADYKYSMIISTAASGPILHADPSLDITAEVLKALNERYAAEKTVK